MSKSKKPFTLGSEKGSILLCILYLFYIYTQITSGCSLQSNNNNGAK